MAREGQIQPLRIAFVVGVFPAISETFIINQVADLEDRGTAVEIFSMRHGSDQNVSARYHEHRMGERCRYLEVPKQRWRRLAGGLWRAAWLAVRRPAALWRILKTSRYGVVSLLYWSAPFIGRRFDLVHCHFGPVAMKFLSVRQVLNERWPIVTSFYGYDVSQVPKQKGAQVYEPLRRAGALFIVMSEDMKRRVVALGFEPAKVRVLPISIDVSSYPFAERRLEPGQPALITTVGRFVEKKGFDDLLRALAKVRQQTTVPWRCAIIGGGELNDELRHLTTELKLDDVVEYKGYMPIESVISFFLQCHLYVQPSKTARSGDME